MSPTTSSPATHGQATGGAPARSSASQAVKESVTNAFAALDELLAASGDAHHPALRYLRRKPGRGLVAVFAEGGGRDVYTVSVAEGALAPDAAASAEAGQGQGQGQGQGLTVRRFPDDPQLPHLAAAMAPAAHPAVAAALESVVRREYGVPEGLVLRSVEAEPLRYKPADRCVIRYRLSFGPDDGTASGSGPAVTHTLVAKLYRDRAEAEAADDLLARLTGSQVIGSEVVGSEVVGSEVVGGVSWSARPLGVVADLPLALTEDLGSARDQVPAYSGLDVIRQGNPGAADAVRAAARALAELHTSGAATEGAAPRTGADEAGKASKRAATLERYVPELALEIARVTEALTRTLTSLPDDGLRPAHGSYKPSQLMVRQGQVFLVDFDQFCLADPALDVGYFLAYLRPAGLWYGRVGRRAWFHDQVATFVSEYTQHLEELGVEAAARSGIVSRAHVYEAALLLKIAARRANRLHSPRPGEVAAVLQEVTACLAEAQRLGGVPVPS